MPASTRRNSPWLRHSAVGALLALALAGCQHYLPYAAPDRDSTEALTRAQAERLQDRSASRSMAPSQIRIATGGLTHPEGGACVDWLSPCWEQGRGVTPAAGGTPMLPRPADAQTFRGFLPCDDAASCSAQRATLTLFANQTWRAAIGAPGGAATALQGCWMRGVDPRQMLLALANGNPMGEFYAESANTLVVRSPDESPSALRFTLTRQPDADLMGGALNPASCAPRA